MRSLSNPVIRKNYQEKVKENFKSSDQNTASALSENIVKNLSESANTVLPRKARRHNRELWKDDEEFNSLIRERSLVQKQSDDYKRITKKLKKRIRSLRNKKATRRGK